MFHYAAYGLHIQSDLRLPELLPAERGGDIVIRVRPAASLEGHDDYDAQISRDEARMALRDLGEFRARAGSEIVVTPVPGADEHLVELCARNIMLPAALYQRGLLLLHAGAIAIDGHVIAFVAESGRGKSSTITTLVDRGHTLIADDIVAVDMRAGTPLVLPAFPSVKLHTAVATMLGRDETMLTEIHPLEEKRSLHVGGADPAGIMPLAAIYVLDEGSQHRIVGLSQRWSFQELVRHSYVPAQATDALGFAQLSQLTGSVDVWRLERAMGLTRLPELASLIEQHVRAMLAVGTQ